MTRSLPALLVLLLSSPLSAATILITSSADSGPGTLRQSILDANSGACAAPCTIDFGLEAEGPRRVRIELESPLPAIRAHGVSILADARRSQLYIGNRLVDVIGTNAGANGVDGLRIEGAERTSIAGISFTGFSGHGLVADHAVGVGIQVCGFDQNARNGILLADTAGVLIRGTYVASNGRSGILAVRANGLEIGSNAIGTDTWNSDPGLPVGNAGHGIHLQDTFNTIASFNYIRHNAGDGIRVNGNSYANDLEYNSFRANALRPIENGGEGQGDPFAPVIESATYNRGTVRLRGYVRTEPGKRVRLQFYRDEGDALVLEASTEARSDDDGVARFETYFHPGEHRDSTISGIATHSLDPVSDVGQTSEFGNAVASTLDEVTIPVTTTADSGLGSLRDAIERVNADSQCHEEYPCAIAFDVAGPIRPLTQLPALTRSAVYLDGLTESGRIEIDGALCAGCDGLRLRTAGRDAREIVIQNITVHSFDGNGLDADGGDQSIYALVSDSSFHSNRGIGVRVERAYVGLGPVFDNRIPLPLRGGCVIGGNRGDGVFIGERGTVSSAGNWIGTDTSGVQPFANGGSGIHSSGGSIAVSSNVIAFNEGDGITIDDATVPNTVLGSQIHSNGGLGIRRAGTSSYGPPAITAPRAEGNETRLTYRLDVPLVGAPFQYIVTIFASSFADASGQGEGRMVVFADRASGPVTKEITIPQNLAGKFLSATVTEFDAFTFIPIHTTSEFSEAVQVTTGSCPTTAPEVSVSGTSFRWKELPGATEYRIWLMKRGDMPRIAYLGTAPEASLQLEPGLYDWVVEARFGAECYGTQSRHGLITVR